MLLAINGGYEPTLGYRGVATWGPIQLRANAIRGRISPVLAARKAAW